MTPASKFQLQVSQDIGYIKGSIKMLEQLQVNANESFNAALERLNKRMDNFDNRLAEFCDGCGDKHGIINKRMSKLEKDATVIKTTGGLLAGAVVVVQGWFFWFVGKD